MSKGRRGKVAPEAEVDEVAGGLADDRSCKRRETRVFPRLFLVSAIVWCVCAR